MKASSFKYHKPATIGECTDLLANLDDARLLAGGQSLMPMLNMRLARFDNLIDINRIDGLSEINVGKETTSVGAIARQAMLYSHAALRDVAPIISAALGFVGHLPTRARGTIGGSLGHMDPSAELPAIASLLDAVVSVVSKDGARQIDARSLAVDYMTTDLSAIEMISGISFKNWPQSHGWGFEEFALRHGDFAIVLVGVLMTRAPDGVINRASVVLSGIGFAPLRLAELETGLIGLMPTETAFKDAVAAITLPPFNNDHHASAAYRRSLATTLLFRALRTASLRAARSEIMQ